MDESQIPPKKQPSWWVSTQGIIAILFILIIGFYLIVEHRTHLAGILPFLIFLLCPLMHLFMHSNHGDHNNKNKM